MDTRDSTALQTVLEREGQRRDAAARALQEAEQRLAQVLAQTASLQDYRLQTSRRWSAHPGQLTSVQQLHTAGGFMQRLDEVLVHQNSAEQRAQSLAAQRRAELLAAEQRVAVVEKVIQRRRLLQQGQQHRREQKASDDAVQLRHAHTAAGVSASAADHESFQGV